MNYDWTWLSLFGLYAPTWDAWIACQIRQSIAWKLNIDEPPTYAGSPGEVETPWSASRLETRYDMTMAEVAEELGISLERVRQIERRALEKLRQPIRARFLRVFATDTTTAEEIAEWDRLKWCREYDLSPDP